MPSAPLLRTSTIFRAASDLNSVPLDFPIESVSADAQLRGDRGHMATLLFNRTDQDIAFSRLQ
jgi:hypothetical protein